MTVKKQEPVKAKANPEVTATPNVNPGPIATDPRRASPLDPKAIVRPEAKKAVEEPKLAPLTQTPRPATPEPVQAEAPYDRGDRRDMSEHGRHTPVWPSKSAVEPVPLPDWNDLGHAAADALNAECMTAEDRKAFYAGDGVARATVLRDQALALAARFSVFIRS